MGSSSRESLKTRSSFYPRLLLHRTSFFETVLGPGTPGEPLFGEYSFVINGNKKLRRGRSPAANYLTDEERNRRSDTMFGVMDEAISRLRLKLMNQKDMPRISRL
jgi:hypothetical protein